MPVSSSSFHDILGARQCVEHETIVVQMQPPTWDPIDFLAITLRMAGFTVQAVVAPARTCLISLGIQFPVLTHTL